MPHRVPLMKLYLVLGSLLVAAGLIFLLQAATPRPKAKRPFPQPAVSPEVRGLIDNAKQLARAGESIQAISALKKAREKEPRLAETYLEAGNVYLAAGQFSGAVEEWKQGLEKAGEDPRILLALASAVLAHQKDPVLALGFLKRAERWDPKLPGLKEAMAETLGQAADLLWQKGDRAAAKEAAEKALALVPDSPAALAVKAQAAEAENRWEEAASLWEKTFSKSPTAEHRRALAQAHKRSGYIQLAKKDREGAVLHFRRTVDLAAEGVDLDAVLDILRNEAESALAEGARSFEEKNFEKAAELFSFSASLLPENPVAQNHLGLALHKLGKKEEAAQAWEESILQAQKVGISLADTPTHSNLLLLYQELGRPEDAKRVGEDYLKKYPDGKYAGEIRALVGR